MNGPNIGNEQAAFLDLARLFSPRHAIGQRKIRLGRANDGGYVMLDDFTGIGAAYSFGVGDDCSWDIEVAERGIATYQFDHTLARSPLQHPKLTFISAKIVGSAEEQGETIAGLLDSTTYYFYSPRPLRLMRAWKPSAGFSMVHSAGHNLAGSTVHLAPQKMIMRHYIFRDQEHAFAKYAMRPFKTAALAQGWHWNRHGQPVHRFKFPSADQLQMLDQPDACDLRMHDPKATHFWMW